MFIDVYLGIFVTDVDSFSSNMTFEGDYDVLNSSGELEIKRAMIYNYLLSIGLPLISDVILLKGIYDHFSIEN